MRVAVCSVGDEIASGDVGDTNAAWLARRLAEVGGDVAWLVAVGDDHDRLSDTLRFLADRCDAVVVGGGLGPTPDDVTRAAVAAVAAAPLERRPDLAAAIERVFAARGAAMPPANLRQADLPAGAVAFAPVGTAPGFRVDVARGDGRRCAVYALPGVPSELRAMAERDVLPDLLRRADRRARVVRDIDVAGMGESAVAAAIEQVTGRAAGDPDVRIAFLARSDAVVVRVSGVGPDAVAARARTDPYVDAVVTRLGDAVAGVDGERLEDAVARLLRRCRWTVATAESCTAGAVAARLAGVPGASDYLKGGLVAYATDVKHVVLGIPRRLLDVHGPVADATAEAMAGRARTLFDADVGVAVVCVAGPTAQGGREVGATVVAVALPDGAVEVRSLDLPGDRATVQARAGSAALDLLRRLLAQASG